MLTVNALIEAHSVAKCVSGLFGCVCVCVVHWQKKKAEKKEGKSETSSLLHWYHPVTPPVTPAQKMDGWMDGCETVLVMMIAAATVSEEASKHGLAI